MEDELVRRLRLLFAEHKLSIADMRAIAQLRGADGSSRARSRRSWPAWALVPVAAALLAGASAAFASGTISLPVSLRYVPFSRAYTAPSANNITCPKPIGTDLAALQRQVNFPLASVVGRDGRMVSASFQGSCSSDPNRGGYAVLNYVFKGVPIQFDEGQAATANGLDLHVRGSRPTDSTTPIWRTVVINASQYGVEFSSAAPDATVLGASWQVGDTLVNATVGSKGAGSFQKGATTGMPLTDFEAMVTEVVYGG